MHHDSPQPHETQARGGPEPISGSLAVVIVHYRHAALTARCLRSLLRHCPSLSQIFVVDNSPGDGSLELLQAEFGDARLRWLPQGANLGFGEGCNAGMRAALNEGAQAVLLLNNDAWVEQDLLAAFVEADRRYRGQALLTACVRAPDGQLWYAGGDYSLTRVSTRHWQAPLRRERRVPFASGCLMWLPRALIEASGGFDSDYFLYLEDLDLCLRLQAAGHPIVCLPQVLALHEVSASTGGRASPVSIYYQNRNRWLLLRRHGRARHWPGFLLLYTLGLLRRCLAGQAGPSLRALADALSSRWGREA